MEVCCFFRGLRCKMWLSCLCVLWTACFAGAFNVDLKFPVVFEGGDNSYFGFTTLLFRNRDGPLLLVGAPKANSSKFLARINEPGVVYRCDIETISCTEVDIDKRGNLQHIDINSDLSYMDLKDNMWLGVSLDVQRDGQRKNIVTCGHLWKNQFYRKHYLPNGVCYLFNSDLAPNERIEKLVPFVDKANQVINPPGIYKYALGQVGTSAAFSQDGKSLFLGAPGYYDWTGTVVNYEVESWRNGVSSNLRATVPGIPEDQTRTPESYLGYAVSSGTFYDDEIAYVATGAPRDGNFHGRVYIYNPQAQMTDKKLVVHQKKEGFQLGEYFGASVLGVNINADKYDDLIVGAPLFAASGVDEGKAYVFVSNGMGLQLYAELLGDSVTNSRFGSALADLGDLNQDGFNDVAIGAPYENDHGSVYIYHGSRFGLITKYVQKISASDINPLLVGFGIHISQGFDIDNNQYPDLFVGSYSSANAVLLRTRPVIQLAPKIDFFPNQINTNVTSCMFEDRALSCVNITACLWYVGKHVPLFLDFQHELIIEHTSQASLGTASRGFFLVNGKTSSVIKRNSTLEIGNEFCTTNSLYLRPNVMDIITPIEVLFRYSLMGDHNPVVFNKNFPILDPTTPKNLTSSVSFQTGCGAEDKCLSDLVLSISIFGAEKNTPIIIGEKTSLTVVIEVINKGEPAYLSELFVTLPSELPSINQDICSSVTDQQMRKKNATLVCELGNPLSKDNKVKIQLKLDLTKVPTYKTEMKLSFEAVTASTEIAPMNNKVEIPLSFQAVADISITGTPSHEQILYDAEVDHRIPPVITHSFFVMNHGPSPVQTVDIVLNIPYTLLSGNDPVNFVTFTSIESDSGKPLTIPAKCNDTYLDIKPLLPGVTEDDTSISEKFAPKENSSFLDFDSAFEKLEASELTEVSSRNKRSKAEKSTQRRKDYSINCETAKCLFIECSASPFLDTRKFAKITVSLQVNMSVLNNVLDPWYRIEFVTSGEVSLRPDRGGIVMKQHHPDKTTIKTTIVHTAVPPSEEIAQWIIFVSIFIGILLLLIILILLVRFGFFKRVQKEKMERMKSQKETNYEPIEVAENGDV